MNRECAAAQVRSIQAAVDAHRAAEQARAPALLREMLHGLERADQYRVRHVDLRGHDVEAIPEAVDEVHIGVTCRSEHHFGAARAPARRVRREIPWTLIGFGLDDASDAALAAVSMDEIGSDQRARHRERRTLVEWTLQRWCQGKHE